MRKSEAIRSPVRNQVLDHLVIMSAEAEWRSPGKPVLQIRLPYIFLADEPVYMAQVPPYLHRPANPLPGTMIGGRFPINVWPRTLSWAFEWHDPDQPLILIRGDPLFYLQFESGRPSAPIQMVEAASADLDQTGGDCGLEITQKTLVHGVHVDT